MNFIEIQARIKQRKAEQSELLDYKRINNVSVINYAELLPGYIDVYEFLERSAIMEYDGNLSRPEADKQAYFELKIKYNFTDFT